MKSNLMDQEAAKAAAKRLFQKINFSGGPLQSYEISSLLNDTYEYLKIRIIVFIQPLSPPPAILKHTPRSLTPTEMDKSHLPILKLLQFNIYVDLVSWTHSHSIHPLKCRSMNSPVSPAALTITLTVAAFLPPNKI